MKSTLKSLGKIQPSFFLYSSVLCRIIYIFIFLCSSQDAMFWICDQKCWCFSSSWPVLAVSKKVFDKVLSISHVVPPWNAQEAVRECSQDSWPKLIKKRLCNIIHCAQEWKLGEKREREWGIKATALPLPGIPVAFSGIVAGLGTVRDWQSKNLVKNKVDLNISRIG